MRNAILVALVTLQFTAVGGSTCIAQSQIKEQEANAPQSAHDKTDTPVTTSKSDSEKSDEVTATVDCMKSAYKDLKTYSDVSVTTNEIKGPMEETLKDKTETVRSTLQCESPNKVRFETDRSLVLCDGSSLWVVNTQTGQYKKEAAPQSFREVRDRCWVLQEDLGIEEFAKHPVLGLLGDASKRMDSLLQSALTATKGANDIDLRIRVSEDGDFGHFVLDRDTCRIREMRFETLQAMKAAMTQKMAMAVEPAAAKWLKAFQDATYLAFVVTISESRVNEPIDPELFKFKPSPRWVEVVPKASNIQLPEDNTLKLR